MCQRLFEERYFLFPLTVSRKKSELLLEFIGGNCRLFALSKFRSVVKLIATPFLFHQQNFYFYLIHLRQNSFNLRTYCCSEVFFLILSSVIGIFLNFFFFFNGNVLWCFKKPLVYMYLLDNNCLKKHINSLVCSVNGAANLLMP